MGDWAPQGAFLGVSDVQLVPQVGQVGPCLALCLPYPGLLLCDLCVKGGGEGLAGFSLAGGGLGLLLVPLRHVPLDVLRCGENKKGERGTWSERKEARNEER